MGTDERREHERQVTLTEAMRREVDERRLDGVEKARLDFLCECLDPACVELVSITLDECAAKLRIKD